MYWWLKIVQMRLNETQRQWKEIAGEQSRGRATDLGTCTFQYTVIFDPVMLHFDLLGCPYVNLRK